MSGRERLVIMLVHDIENLSLRDLRDERAKMAAWEPVVRAAVAKAEHLRTMLSGEDRRDSGALVRDMRDTDQDILDAVDNLPPDMRPKGGQS